MMVLAAGLSYPVSQIKQISLCKNIKNVLLNVYTPVSNPSQIAVGEPTEYEITCIFTKRIVVCLFSFGHSNVCPSSIYGF